MLLILKAFQNMNKDLKVKVRSGKERAHSAEGICSFQMVCIISYVAFMLQKTNT